MSRACWIAVAFWACASHARAAEAPRTLGPAPIGTRQNVFAIPFRVDASGGKQALEVQLHVSDDEGASWHLVSKVAPSAGRFKFTAPHDGQYWFMVRTLDQQGVLRPAGPPLPELKVIVDTVPPVLELKAQRGNAGEIRAQWRIRDMFVRPESLRISYRAAGSTDAWQIVATDPPKAEPGSSNLVGEATWWPTPAGASVVIRAEVTDIAGNTTASQARLEPVASIAGTDAVPAPIRPLPPVSDDAAPLVAGASPFETSESAPQPMAPADTAGSVPPAMNNGPLAGESSRRNPVVPWQAQRVAEPLVQAETNEPPPAMPSTFPGTPEQVPAPQAAASRPTTHHLAGRAVAPAENVLPPPAVANDPPSAEVQPKPRVPDNVPAPPPSAPNAAAPPPAQLAPVAPALSGPALGQQTATPAEQPPQPEQRMPPAGVRPRMVNSRRFELGYGVDSLGADGISKVELWGTRDGGHHWQCYGTDSDTRSPFPVKVDGEGVYGFRMIVETTSGLRGMAPRPGDLPEIWVGVDTSKPTAQLLAAEPHPTTKTTEVLMRWEAKDQLLAARPITLLFSQSPTGPWTVLASGLENSGEYRWRIDPRIPDSIYIRLEVRDEAGNMRAVESSRPISIDRVRPQGRILDVRPIGEARQRPATLR